MVLAPTQCWRTRGLEVRRATSCVIRGAGYTRTVGSDRESRTGMTAPPSPEESLFPFPATPINDLRSGGFVGCDLLFS